jgi:regulator of sigma E protease
MIGAYYVLVGTALVLGVMILVHEFGHFAVAKLLGVRVEVFSIGFGKRLIGFKRGDTDYRISALPLGGYVKMTGVNAIDLPEESSESSNDTEAFLKHPRWQRLLIAIAGPVANLVLAVGLMTALFAIHHEIPYGLHGPAVVGWCLPGYPAEQAGIKEGDRIVQIGDVSNPTWQDVHNKVLISPDQPLKVTVLRGGQQLAFTVQPKAEGKQKSGDAGWVPNQPFVVTMIEPGMPGEAAGMKQGDEILSANGTPIRNTAAMQLYLQSNKEMPVQLEVLRNGQKMTLTVHPRLTASERGEAYRIGFGSQPVQVEKLPLLEAFSRSVDDCKKFSMLIFELIGRMVENKVSVKQMSGPVEIALTSGEVVRSGSLNDMIAYMAMISLNLGLLNLLPIPILDGGLIAMLLVESLMRRDIKESIKLRLYQAAFVFLVLFACIVIFNDVVKRLPGQ